MLTDFSKMDKRTYFTSVLIHFIVSTLGWLYYEIATPYFVFEMSEFEQFGLSMILGFLIVILYLNLKGILIDRKRESLGDYRPKPIPVLKGKEADRFIEIEKNPLTIDEKKDLEECLNLFRKRERT